VDLPCPKICIGFLWPKRKVSSLGAKPKNVEQAFRQFQVRLLRYIAKRVGDESEAQDVLQDVFLRATRHAETLKQARTPLAWLYTVTNSAIADHHRKKSRTPQGNDTALAGLIQPEQAALEGLDRCLLPLIKALPAPYQQALIFTDLEGGRQVDYAAKYGLKPATARAHVQRGRARLRKLVLGCCAIELDHDDTISTLQPKHAGCC
jgi:RNA polymerase sigma-70 factor (ECF subfamily)